MKRMMMIAALMLATTGPAMAQTMAATDVGVQPMAGTSATDYVKLAADGDMYEIASSKLAMSKAQRPDVKKFAREMVSDHQATTKTLMAALKNPDRTIAKPGTRMSTGNEAKIALLKKAPKASFDDLYLQQQMQAHQTAWALHGGYATDGTDPALKQVASTAVPVIERHLMHVKQMTTTAMSGM
ncbi:DUF4142 domain-containing protein [Sphingomonas montana]|uniref:DUF4142 domain-containing protein n=1 Tax=Sphingomonas montana TaxID=1843236 RepID=UPI0013ED31DC|nr:DUF4142 domain-containing protein [Sphingomonas montana]